MDSFIMEGDALGSIVNNFDEEEQNLFEEVLELRVWGYTSKEITKIGNLRESLSVDYDDYEKHLNDSLDMIDDSLGDGLRDTVVALVLADAETTDTSYTLTAKAISANTILVHRTEYC